MSDSIKMVGFNAVSGYDVFRNHVDFSAYTIAALMTAGMVRITPTGGIYRPEGKGRPDIFKGLVRGTAATYWTHKDRLGPDGLLTVKGLNVVQARLEGKARGYNTNLARVKEFHAAMTAAEPSTVDYIKFDSPLRVSAR